MVGIDWTDLQKGDKPMESESRYWESSHGKTMQEWWINHLKEELKWGLNHEVYTQETYDHILDLLNKEIDK